MLKARPNLNGNSPETMIDDLIAVRDAAIMLQQRLANLHASALHSRNYQTVENAAQAHEDDMEQVQAFVGQVRAIAGWAADSAIAIKNG